VGGLGEKVTVLDGWSAALGVRLYRMVWRDIMASTSLSVSGSRGECGLGLAIAVARSKAALMTRSVELAVGMVTCFGDHSTVSHCSGFNGPYCVAAV